MHKKNIRNNNQLSRSTRLLGKINYWRLQLAGYFSILSFGGIIYLVVVDNPFLTWLNTTILLVVGIPILLYINDRYIFPATQNEQFEKHPRFMEIEENIASIKASQLATQNEIKEIKKIIKNFRGQT